MKLGWNPTGTLHGNTLFKSSKADYARIFSIGSDTIEASSGNYELQLATSPLSVKRGGISELGAIVVSKFKDSVWVEVEEQISDKLVNYRLMQNYPNPFNPITQISYITLKVHNLLGQEVTTLFEGMQQPGNYEATSDGSRLSSGVYFYRLRTNLGFMQTKKLLLLK